MKTNQNYQIYRDDKVDLSEAARSIGDCRLCGNYSFDRDIEVEFFNCRRGHFHYVDYGSHIEGEMGWFGCEGKDFALDKSSRWWPYLKDDVVKKAREIERQKAEETRRNERYGG